MGRLLGLLLTMYRPEELLRKRKLRDLSTLRFWEESCNVPIISITTNCMVLPMGLYLLGRTHL